MLIVALVLAVIGLAALVAAVATSNELLAWVCIGASALGVFLLIVDAIRDRAQRRVPVPETAAAANTATELTEPDSGSVESSDLGDTVADEADNSDGDGDLAAEIAVEDHPDEVVHDEPDYDLPSDDEPEFPVPAEEDAVHIVGDDVEVDRVGEDAAEQDAAEQDAAEQDAAEWDAAAEQDDEEVSRESDREETRAEDNSGEVSLDESAAADARRDEH